MAMDGDWIRARRTTEEEEERPLKVVFASPAEHFTDAGPIGNGSLGAMVWGGVASEKLQLNHDTLWTGAPGNQTDPKAPAALAVVRKLVDDGRFVDATKAASDLFGGPTEAYQPLGDLNLEFGTSNQGSAPHLNINLQMNYWPTLPSNLSECQEPLLDFIASLAVNGTKTAKVNYEASGWVTHHVSDIWAKSTAFNEDAKYAVWPMGGGCMALYTSLGTLSEFLKNTAYPLLEGCAMFLTDWLTEGAQGYLETNPSTSPEHPFIAPGPGGQQASVSYSTTMDISIIREIFMVVISSAEVLGKSDTTLV